MFWIIPLAPVQFIDRVSKSYVLYFQSFGTFNAENCCVIEILAVYIFGDET